MAPVFHPPMGPRSGPPIPGIGTGPAMPSPGSGRPLPGAGVPPGGAYGTPRRPDPEPAYDGELGYGNESAYSSAAGSDDGQLHDYGSGYDEGQPYGSTYDTGESYDTGQSYDSYSDAQPYGSGYNDGPAYDTADYRPGTDVLHDDPIPAAPERSGKRRADVTAVDLGYTGRRSRPNHATTDPDPDPDHPDPTDGQDYWRQPSEPW